MLYFAYGSNLNQERMLERCSSAQVIGLGRMKGWKLVFQNNNNGRIVANIMKGSGRDYVDGVIYHITHADVKKLDKFEGHPHVYKRILVTVEFEDRGKLEVDTYIMSQEYMEVVGYKPYVGGYYVPVYRKRERYFGVPEDDYLDHIVKGYEQFGFSMRRLMKLIDTMKELAPKNEPAEEIEDETCDGCGQPVAICHCLDEIEEQNLMSAGGDNTHTNVDNDKYRVFVYGTLMSGECNHRLLDGARFVGHAMMRGAVCYDLPYGFPAVKLIDSDSVVVGEVYEVGREGLAQLDMLEGYDERTDSGMYLRRTASVEMGDGSTATVFFYLWNRMLPDGAIICDSGERWSHDLYR